MRIRTAALVALVAAAGCGSDPPPSPTEPPPPAAGYFVGRASNGVGASVDFRGFDATSRAIARALRADGPRARPVHVGIASVVNGSDRPVAVPRFAGLGAGDAVTPLVAAGRALAPLRGAEARRARARLRRDGAIPAEGSAVVYLVLRADPSALRAIRMRSGPGRPAELARRGG